jgi:hypothetical protein
MPPTRTIRVIVVSAVFFLFAAVAYNIVATRTTSQHQAKTNSQDARLSSQDTKGASQDTKSPSLQTRSSNSLAGVDERPQPPVQPTTVTPVIPHDERLTDDHTPRRVARISPARIARLLSKLARPKVWQVKPDETVLAYQESNLVWCAEEYISENGCTLPLQDALAQAGRAKSGIRAEEFKIDPFGITHVPTGTRFNAYPFVQRYGFFRDKNLSVRRSNSKIYEAEALHVVMLELWRERMDALDPNGPIEPK